MVNHKSHGTTIASSLINKNNILSQRRPLSTDFVLKAYCRLYGQIPSSDCDKLPKHPPPAYHDSSNLYDSDTTSSQSSLPSMVDPNLFYSSDPIVLHNDLTDKSTDGQVVLEQGQRRITVKRDTIDQRFGMKLDRADEIDKVITFIGVILANSPAERAGLKVGDQLVRVNGLDVDQMTLDQLTSNIRTADSSLDIVFKPARTLNIPLATTVLRKKNGKLGLRLVSGGGRLLHIELVLPNSPAALTGLRPGQPLICLNGRLVIDQLCTDVMQWLRNYPDEIDLSLTTVFNSSLTVSSPLPSSRQGVEDTSPTVGGAILVKPANDFQLNACLTTIPLDDNSSGSFLSQPVRSVSHISNPPPCLFNYCPSCQYSSQTGRDHSHRQPSSTPPPPSMLATCQLDQVSSQCCYSSCCSNTCNCVCCQCQQCKQQQGQRPSSCHVDCNAATSNGDCQPAGYVKSDRSICKQCVKASVELSMIPCVKHWNDDSGRSKIKSTTSYRSGRFC